MKKITILTISILFFLNPSFCKEINFETAKTVAKNFYVEKVSQSQTKNLPSTIVLNEAISLTKANEQQFYYVFNVNTDGFVIVSGDDLLLPILAYSFEGNYDPNNQPPAVMYFLGDYKNQIISARNENKEVSAEISAKWDVLSRKDFRPKTKATKAKVEALLITKWNQNFPYNADCPEDEAGPGGYVYAGCVATAIAQVLRYYNYPATGNGSHSYNSNYGYEYANFGATTYDWSNMPCKCSVYDYAEIAKLSYHCGVAVDMGYSPDGSGAWGSAAVFENYFRFSTDASYKYRSDYNDTDWKNLLKQNLDLKRPMYYTGRNSEGGHAFVCDGYDDGNGYFHFNWGWGGQSDGFYSIDGMAGDYNNSQTAIVGLHPSSSTANSCSGTKTITTYSGAFNDGSGIDDYQNNLTCYYLVQPACGISLKVKFEAFDLGTNDQVVIYDGATTGSTVLETFSASNPPTIGTFLNASGTSLLFHFTTDGSGTGDGWEAYSESFFCGGTITRTDNNGTLDDGSGSCNYFNGKYCMYRIEPANGENITLNFSNFDLGSSEHKLIVKNSVSAIIETFSSSNRPSGNFTTNSPIITLYFDTRVGDYLRNGWTVDYSTGTNINEITNNKYHINVYPNPSNTNDVKLAYELTQSEDVNISVSNIIGEEIGNKQIYNQAGKHVFNLNEIASPSDGVYFVRISIGNSAVTHKVIYY